MNFELFFYVFALNFNPIHLSVKPIQEEIVHDKEEEEEKKTIRKVSI